MQVKFVAKVKQFIVYRNIDFLLHFTTIQKIAKKDHEKEKNPLVVVFIIRFLRCCRLHFR